MLALLACAPSDAGAILPSTLEGSQKSDALAGCRFALDGQLYDVGALAGMTMATLCAYVCARACVEGGLLTVGTEGDDDADQSIRWPRRHGGG